MLIPLLEIGDDGLKFIGAAIAIGIGGFGPGLAIGNLVGKAMERIRHDIVHSIYQVSLSTGPSRRSSNGAGESPMEAVAGRRKEAVPAGSRKVGRNEPCPCGNGKKYKRCHGSNA